MKPSRSWTPNLSKNCFLNIYFSRNLAHNLQSPDAEGLIKAKEALAQGQNTEWWNHWGLVLPGSLLLLNEAAGDPLRDAPQTSLFLHCPSLSTPVNQRELQSLPFLQVAERSTLITDKRAVLPLFMPHMDPATADTRGHLWPRSNMFTPWPVKSESKQCNWFQTCS